MTDDGAGGKHWKNEGQGELTASKVKTLTPISSFSPFTLGSGSNVNVLPVDWLSFDVNGKGNIAEIKWSAIEHADNAYYELQRSTDGVNFETIHMIDINAEGKQTYKYSNELSYNLTGTEVFYRLEQFDVDGSSSYSQTKSFKVLLDESTISVYPVPVQDKLSVLLDINIYEAESIELVAVDGSISYPASEIDEKQIIVDMEDLASGTYILKIKIGEQTIPKLITKE